MPQTSQPLISICIPSRGPIVGLWATMVACEAQLHDIPHEYCLAITGRELGEPEHLLQKNGAGAVHIYSNPQPLPPPVARNEAAKMASGEWLVFFDDHCIPDTGFFEHLFGKLICWLVDGEVEGSTWCIHGTYTTHAATHRYYHAILDTANPMKADYSRIAHSTNPYRCASAPTGFFAILREDYLRIGGQGDFWRGFGGEEVYFDLKCWLNGIEVWMDPQLRFYHFSCRSETRGYDKTINDWNYEEGLRQLGEDNVRGLLKRLSEQEIPQ